MKKNVKNKIHKVEGRQKKCHEFSGEHGENRISIKMRGEEKNLRVQQQQMNKKLRNEASFTTI